MDCQDARRLIDRGLKPGTTDAQRTNLGFHLARCKDCRTYRRDVEALQVLSSWLARPACAAQPKPPVRRWQTALRPARAAGAALMISGALAVLPSVGLLPTTATAAKTTVARTIVSESQTVLPARWQATVFAVDVDTLAAPQFDSTPAAASDTLLRDLLEAPPAPAELRVGREKARAALNATEQARTEALLQNLLETPPAPAELRVGREKARAAWEAEQARAASEAELALEAGTTELALGQELNLPAIPAGAANTSWHAQTYTVASTYVVQRGDSLWAIAERFYGNGALWPAIYYANTHLISNPNLIYPNQRFDIPAQPVWENQPTVYYTSNQPSSGRHYNRHWASGNYRIVSGDTLSDIAYRVYGDASRWHEIYAWNEGAIGCDPDLIYPGTLLNLPPA